MRRLFFTMMLFLGMTAARAYDYAYLVLQKTDGTTVSVSTSSATLSASGSSATLTVNGTVYTVSDLAYLFFTNTPVNEITIPSIGWATFCSDSPVNYSSVSGLTAYTATFGDTEITLHELSEPVPAGTGVVLCGTAGDYSLPVVAASSAATPTYNDLIGTTSAVSAPANSYALAKLSDSSVGFKLITTGVNIPANKAYYTASSSSRSYYTFGGTATAINGIASDEVADGAIYDLQGRLVTNPRKGVYIRNGRKIIIK